MTVDRERIRRYLQTADLEPLFIEELGWDHQAGELPVTVDDVDYTLAAVAEKRGMVAYRCDVPAGQDLPARPTRVKIERQVARLAHQHLIVFLSPDGQRQVWQWARRDPGQPVRHREQGYDRAQTGEALLEKLQVLAFSLDEEEGLTHVDVTSRVRAAFDVERVTKRFYDLFRKERDAFARFLQGVPDEDMQRWYVSVMLNRLMFIYFIQKRGFLDGDVDYLRHKLMDSQARGANRYYREFLCPLFFEGFACRAEERSAETNRLLGNVPYLDGGLFQRHEVEQHGGTAIRIPDAAFARLFAFFEAYQWHLDERPLRRDDEINPDVLGYIFEKYINQKEMGAYYTKEDITGYICQNTIIPFLLDRARAGCRVAFEGEASVWQLLQENPDRYIYDAMRKGVELSLPREIAAGLDDVTLRGPWNAPAPEGYALPTEIWREAVARRQRYEEVWLKMVGGEVRTAEDLITYNLDIRQFAQDVIEHCEGPELLRAFWKLLEKVTVLDPACGSGAFLFAALNILQPLYEACLERMEEFVREADEAGSRRYPDFRAALERIAGHRNRSYHIHKTIMVNNLFGVDIMDEAVEICKLRLFLKLVAQVDRPDEIEPLPDIDFNIKAGNTLVGFTSLEGVQRALTTGAAGQMLLPMLEIQTQLQRIAERAEVAARAYEQFRHQQLLGNGIVTHEDRARLGGRLAELSEELSRALARTYGVDPDALEYGPWLRSHKPFHWFTDFYGIMGRGGFDVIIGNPPWREYAAVRRAYSVRGYATESCGNLYALCIERALSLRTCEGGQLSYIVQLPLVSSSRMAPVRKLLRQHSSWLSVIPFADRPGKLFDGLQNCRSVIFVSRGGQTGGEVAPAVTGYQRWPTEMRPHLFSRLGLLPTTCKPIYPGVLPKSAHPLQESLFRKVKAAGTGTTGMALREKTTNHFVFYQEATRYWVKGTLGLPYYTKNGHQGPPPHGRYLYCSDAPTALAVCALLNSSLFYLYFIAHGDCFHLSGALVRSFPTAPGLLQDPALSELGNRLMADLVANAARTTIRTSGGDSITYAEFYAAKSKPIIDQIDRALAQHFGFTAEELDFVLNYDFKYRVGLYAPEESVQGEGAHS